MPFSPLLFLLVVVVLFLFSAFKILNEYERGVIFQLGRFHGIKGPGLIILIPALQRMVRVDLRTIVMDVPSQDVISRDNVSVKVNAVLYFRVIDPEKAIIQVQNRVEATSQLAQTTLRSVLGQHELDDMLAEREKLNADVQTILDQQTASWGIKVINVEIKHVDLDESMIRAIAAQAEAERTRRAKVIHAEGEFQASQRLSEAAAILSSHPQAMQLRYLQTLTEISGEKNSHTIVFPVPIDLVNTLMEHLRGGSSSYGSRRAISLAPCSPERSAEFRRLVARARRAPATVEHDAVQRLLVAAAEGDTVHAVRTVDRAEELAARCEDVGSAAGSHVDSPLGVDGRAVAALAAAQLGELALVGQRPVGFNVDPASVRAVRDV